MNNETYPEGYFNVEAMDKLCAGLKHASAEHKTKFDMAYYTYNENQDLGAHTVHDDYAVQKNHCGTAACLAGHGPATGALTPILGEGWADYAERLLFTKPEDVDHECDTMAATASEFVFSAGWALYDNTLEGAILRWYFLRDTNRRPPRPCEVGASYGLVISAYRQHGKNMGYI